jgi:hypothetical protein
MAGRDGSNENRSCGTHRYRPRVRVIKLIETREISPYVPVHPDDER